MENTEQNPSSKELYELKKQEKEAKNKTVKNSKVLKRTLFWLIVFGAIGGSVWGLAKIAKQTPGGQQAVILDAVSTGDWTKGNADSKVTLIEYSDFQCPACGAYYPLLKQLIQEEGEKFNFVYRHFPLPQHGNAKNAGYAAEAAGKQGKFWEMHNMIFEGQRVWSESKKAKEIFADYAKTLELNMEQFEKNRDSQATKEKVENDYNGGQKAGVNATPTFFLNGKRIQPANYENFKSLLNQAVEGSS